MCKGCWSRIANFQVFSPDDVIKQMFTFFILLEDVAFLNHLTMLSWADIL